MIENHLPPCVRGCTRARQHITDCEDRDACEGCEPVGAEHGRLCYRCHQRLVQWIEDAPAQVHLLRLVVGKGSPNSVPNTVETNAKIVTQWRTSDGQAHPSGLYAKGTESAFAESEPIRLAAIDVAQEIEDWFSIQIEELVQEYEQAGPDRAMTAHERKEGKHGKWVAKFVGLDGPDDDGDYVWVSPPERYVLASGARWLYAQVGRFEQRPEIGDLYSELGEIMSRAHAIAPWRKECAVLDGIECPACHKMGLVRFGGDSFVTCSKCNEHMHEDRYWVWVKILSEERKATA